MTGTQPSLAQVRIVDPILSDHARGYSNADMVGGVLFPTVDMPTRGAKRIEFGRDAFRRRQTRRAPGTPIARMTVGNEGKPVMLHQEALQAVTPTEYQEDARITPGLDLQRESVDVVLAVIALEREIQQANVARNAAAYSASNKEALTVDDKWNDPDSDPLTQVNDASEVIRKRTGRKPNTLLLPGGVGAALKVHPKILDHFKYTTSASVTMEMLRAYFDLPTVVSGDAIYDVDDATSVDVWGNDVILAYVPPAGQRNMRLPSYGYTYQLRGHPAVGQVEWDKDVLSHTNNVIDEFSAELVGADAGFLFQGAI
ncbi:hypothetical protein [Sphingobium aquiterrae]|uniref:major capsid protein n=1 Tax=Sphingobium aquiterrae TaxID=2038656 RepID=UPI0030193044